MIRMFEMKKIYYIFIFLIIFSLPALADLTAAGTSRAPSYVNTNQTFVMINLTLNGTNVRVTGINVTFGGTAGIGNISQVLIYNDTNSNAAYDAGELLLGNSTFSGTNTCNVSINLVVSGTSKLLIAYKIHNSATRFVSVNASLASSSSITANETIAGTFPIDSSSSQIQDLHASASVSPSYVDTNVVNQSFIYNITTTGSDYVNRTVIVLPGNYVIISVTNVTINGSNQEQNCALGVNQVCVQRSNTQINVTYPNPGLTSKAVRIYFTANTSSSVVTSMRFNSTIDSGNCSLTAIETDVVNSKTNVTTKQLINVDIIRAIKSTALANGTDYWEFNFTLNITANVSGLVQFRMNNWNSSSANQMMNLTNQTSLINATFYASLRKSDASTNVFNVTSEYGSSGVSLTARENNLYYVVLKMIIRSGTPIASDWWTTYWTLFRSTPS